MFMPIQVNENSAEPLYAQIKNQLRALILSGQLEVGTLLPSIREFASQLKCSVITVRRVYQDLEVEGLLRTRQGTGTFVAHVQEDDKDKYRKKAVEEAILAAIQAALQVQMSEAELRACFDEMIMRTWDVSSRGRPKGTTEE
nr:GntR family transcriptional regulator [Paenibacillus taiwanensis]